MREPEQSGGDWAALMRAAQQGDAAAYAQLLREVAPAVRSMVGRRWGRGAEVEDLVQEVLLSIHAVRHTYDPARPFLPWLMAIVRHRIADGARRHARKAANEVTIDVLSETFLVDATNPGDDRGADTDALHKAIAGLPPGQRQAIELLKVREMSLKEASAASGLSIVALKVAVHRAIKTLRSKLDERT